MRSIVITSAALLISFAAYSQYNQKYIHFYDLSERLRVSPSDTPAKIVEKSWLSNLLRWDKVTTLRLSSPFVATRAQSEAGPNNDVYWTGYITTQSFNKGKLGTFYYWDVQGNLRETRTFLDIAGKNKRGLKLVFPRR